MRIDSVKFSNIENVYKNKKIGLESKSGTKSDSVQISDLGKYLNKVNSNKEEINIDKINDIKKRIENGTYSVDSKTLAKKIIEKMEEDNN